MKGIQVNLKDLIPNDIICKKGHGVEMPMCKYKGHSIPICPECETIGKKKYPIITQNQLSNEAQIFKIKRLKSVIPFVYQKKNFDNYFPKSDKQKSIKTEIKLFCDKWALENQEYGLLLTGKNGTGKTHLALAVAHRLIERHFIEVIYIKAIQIFNNINNAELKNKVIKEFCDVDLLIIEEVGKQRNTQEEDINLELILDERIINNKKTIIISNAGFDLHDSRGKYLDNYLGSGVVDRLNEFNIYSFDWKSYRKK